MEGWIKTIQNGIDSVVGTWRDHATKAVLESDAAVKSSRETLAWMLAKESGPQSWADETEAAIAIMEALLDPERRLALSQEDSRARKVLARAPEHLSDVQRERINTFLVEMKEALPLLRTKAE